MSAAAAVSFLMFHAGLLIGAWAFGGHSTMLFPGVVMFGVSLALFRLNKLHEGP